MPQKITFLFLNQIKKKNMKNHENVKAKKQRNI